MKQKGQLLNNLKRGNIVALPWSLPKDRKAFHEAMEQLDREYQDATAVARRAVRF